MALNISCPACGYQFELDDAAAGQVVQCGACGGEFQVTAPAAAAPAQLQMPDDLALMPLATTTAPERPVPGSRIPASHAIAGSRVSPAAPPPQATTVKRAKAVRQWNLRYFYLAIALLPLALSVAQHKKDVEEQNIEHRIEQTLENATDAQREKVIRVMAHEHASYEEAMNELLTALPDSRLKGAHLPRNSSAHWLYALVSAAVFLTLIVLAFPTETMSPGSLIAVGLFTGTIGILLLLGLQYAAIYSQGVWLRGGGIIVILFYIVKFIGFSYRCALDGSNGFPLSFMGFTCGVGFCEEACKALPMLYHFRSRPITLDWRGACVMGLASGAGFGVSEGITYASHYYNGISGGEIYVIRFVSCVALHAIWSAAAGITIWRKQVSYQRSQGFLEVLLTVAGMLILPMILHGLYDTLLKQNMEFYALLTAVASMGWLTLQIEQAKGMQEQPEHQGNAAPAVRI